jgi:hypothetical protein
MIRSAENTCSHIVPAKNETGQLNDPISEGIVVLFAAAFGMRNG